MNLRWQRLQQRRQQQQPPQLLPLSSIVVSVTYIIDTVATPVAPTMGVSGSIDYRGT
jgi:hypothetical protein